MSRLVGAAWVSSAAVNFSYALEGSSTAGPIGGTDIRTAQLPPPGLYGGLVLLHATADRFFDGGGNLVPALADLELTRQRVGGFLVYVPPVQIFGGSVAIGGFLPGGRECGRLVAATPSRCIAGFGDPYVEVGWSRFYGALRPSKYANAFPIAEGLTVALGFGVVIPAGRYDAADATLQGLTLGNNIWDFAPTAAFTYVTPPIIADGTELSARIYWNNYLTNPDTHYKTGSVINIDFALTEKFGPFQAGFAGYYVRQIADDRINGVAIVPDGRRAEILSLGAVFAYDMPQYGASIKLKPLVTVIMRNAVHSPGVALSIVKKL